MSNPIQQEYKMLPEETRWTLEKRDLQPLWDSFADD